VIAEFSSLVIFLYSAGRGSREESGNFCAADIPETSAFIAFGPSQGFDDPRCSEAGEGGLGLCVSKLVAGSGCTCEPDGEDLVALASLMVKISLWNVATTLGARLCLITRSPC
jgi:hypothetical protein